MICEVFQKSCVTFNYSNTFHTGKNDCQFVSHSVITTPNAFIQREKHKHGDFLIGTNDFHYSEANFSIIFSAANMSHYTTIPSRNTETPKILMGEDHLKQLLSIRQLLRLI